MNFDLNFISDFGKKPILDDKSLLRFEHDGFRKVADIGDIKSNVTLEIVTFFNVNKEKKVFNVNKGKKDKAKFVLSKFKKK